MNEANSIDPRERRRGERTPWRGPLTVRLPAQRFVAESENLSSMGVLLFGSSELLVEVELEQPDGSLRRISGKLVRYNRLASNKCGIAIEFGEHQQGLPNDPQAW